MKAGAPSRVAPSVRTRDKSLFTVSHVLVDEMGQCLSFVTVKAAVWELVKNSLGNQCVCGGQVRSGSLVAPSSHLRGRLVIGSESWTVIVETSRMDTWTLDNEPSIEVGVSEFVERGG
jgi:hypothetical protein